jgi:hypothetical protein
MEHSVKLRQAGTHQEDKTRCQLSVLCVSIEAAKHTGMLNFGLSGATK